VYVGVKRSQGGCIRTKVTETDVFETFDNGRE